MSTHYYSKATLHNQGTYFGTYLDCVRGGLAVLAAEGLAAEHGEVVEGGGAGFLDRHGRGDIYTQKIQWSRVSSVTSVNKPSRTSNTAIIYII